MEKWGNQIVRNPSKVHVLPFPQNTPITKQMQQQRNSNLRELPVAPGNTIMNSARPAANVRPVAKATQGVRPGQSTQPVPAGGRGRGQVAAKTELQPGGDGSTVVRKEIPGKLSSTAPQVSLLALVVKKEKIDKARNNQFVGLIDIFFPINDFKNMFILLK